jgi:hypothetical protein
MPNPAHEFVQIKTHSNLQIEQVDLRDMQGRLIFNSKTKNTIFNVDISSLKSGVYFIEIQTQKGSATKKLIVAH